MREHLRAKASPPDLKRALEGRSTARSRLAAFSATPVDAPVGPRSVVGGTVITAANRVTVIG